MNRIHPCCCDVDSVYVVTTTSPTKMWWSGVFVSYVPDYYATGYFLYSAVSQNAEVLFVYLMQLRAASATLLSMYDIDTKCSTTSRVVLGISHRSAGKT